MNYSIKKYQRYAKELGVVKTWSQLTDDINVRRAMVRKTTVEMEWKQPKGYVNTSNSESETRRVVQKSSFQTYVTVMFFPQSWEATWQVINI